MRSAEPAFTAAWEALARHRQELAGTHLRDLFASDPARARRYTLELDGLALDYSRNPVTDRTLSLLLALAEAAGVADWTERMFRGERINATENRAVLHTALRAPRDRPLLLGGIDVMAEVHATLDRFLAFAEQVRGGTWTGATGRRIARVVNIGIGGSDLGPAMACDALSPYRHKGIDFAFVANVDGTAITRALAESDPESTLFIIASKTFTTQETMTNAATARAWLVERLGEAAIPHHFVAVSTNRVEVERFGIDPANMFGFWDWVGGRYSLWSAIGLPIAIAIGAERFREFLAGAAAMDRHFREAPPETNIPVLLALLGVWQINFLGRHTQAILPYDQSLARFPAYLQQLEMESNGKRVSRRGEIVPHATGAVVWGEPGTNGQHAFYQLLHQGTTIVPADFLAPARAQHGLDHHHRILLANLLAQAQALMQGRTEEEARAELVAQGLAGEALEKLLPHKVFPGDRPSNTILFETLDPRRLGMLIALYEHKVFVQGIVWNIHSFDQWGVELGKQLAGGLLPALEGRPPAVQPDAASREQIERLRRWRGQGAV
ncbi:MAG: glucose-6-phosphate isomerase [Alphaproteobacteria bacterium]|nr:glucose-6-phosphate isomerase [Alphaproteobacteria bacterium]